MAQLVFFKQTLKLVKWIITCRIFHEHPSAKCIHLPIDSVLLKNFVEYILTIRKIWKEYENIAWSKFDSVQYDKVMYEIVLNDDPL